MSEASTVSTPVIPDEAQVYDPDANTEAIVRCCRRRLLFITFSVFEMFCFVLFIPCVVVVVRKALIYIACCR
jgi:hypothetical protein